MEQTNPQPNPPTLIEMPTNPPTSSSSPNRSVLIILLVIFLVILTSLVTYPLVKSQTPSPTPVVSPAPLIQISPAPSVTDETANWKTFKTATFSVKLPPDYISTEVMDSKFMITKTGNLSTMIIDSFFSGDPRTYDQILLMAQKSSQSIKQGQTVGGATYFVPTYDSQDQAQTGISKTAVFKYNNNAIIVNMLLDEPNNTIQSTFDQIITTLEPLDKNPEICVPNQNYQSDAYNPITCICAKDYVLKRLSLIEKKCPDGQGSCPTSIVSCQKK